MSNELVESIRFGYLRRLLEQGIFWALPLVAFGYALAMWATTQDYRVHGIDWIAWACGLAIPWSVWQAVDCVRGLLRPNSSPIAKRIRSEAIVSMRPVEVRRGVGSQLVMRHALDLRFQSGKKFRLVMEGRDFSPQSARESQRAMERIASELSAEAARPF